MLCVSLNLFGLARIENSLCHLDDLNKTDTQFAIRATVLRSFYSLKITFAVSVAYFPCRSLSHTLVNYPFLGFACAAIFICYVLHSSRSRDCVCKSKISVDSYAKHQSLNKTRLGVHSIFSPSRSNTRWYMEQRTLSHR